MPGDELAALRSIIDERDRRYAERFDAQEKAVSAALAAAKEAVVKAEVAADKRFDAVNEFRGQLADQAANLMPRAEAVVVINNLAEKIDVLDAFKSKAVGAFAIGTVFAGLVGAAVMKVLGG